MIQQKLKYEYENRCIYFYEFEDNSVYVGLTYDLNDRNLRHIRDNLSSVNERMKIKLT